MAESRRVNLDKPRYDQSSFVGRWKHFFLMTYPNNAFTAYATLEKSKDIVTRYQSGEDIDGMSVDELWEWKTLYDSAFHPDTKEKMNIFGRMCFQVPGNTLITGCMLAWYKNPMYSVAIQFINQSFNAVVNYTNRSGDRPISDTRLYGSFAAATGGAMGTVLGLQHLSKTMPSLVQRMVPFTAVAVANCINIPSMRSYEVTEGTPVYDEKDNFLGDSPKAAKKGIMQTVISRIIMAMPGMIIPPIICNHIEKSTYYFVRYPGMVTPAHTLITGAILCISTPTCLALFPQRGSMSVSKVEPWIKEALEKNGSKTDVVYFNKGL